MLFKKSFSVIYLLLIILTGIQNLYGQETLSVRERFRVDVIEGCAPLTVKIVEEDFSQVPNYDPNVDYVRWYGYRSDNPDIEPLEPHPSNGKILTLPEAGEYYIIQLLQNEGKDSLRVIVHEALTPVFEASNCGNSSVSVKVDPENQNYDFYQVIMDGQAAQQASLQNNYTVFFSGLPTGATTVKVKGMYEGEAITNNCGETSQEIQVSSTLEPAKIQSLHTDLEENNILINYELQQGAIQVLEVATIGATNFTEYDRLQGNELVIENLDPANNFYCFRIRTLNLCNPEEGLTSNTICSAGLRGSSSAAGIEINFNTASARHIQAILLRDGQEIHDFGSLGQDSFTDTKVVCGSTYTYAVKLVYPGGVESLTESIALTSEYSATLPAPENISSYWQNNAPYFRIHLDNEPQQGQYRAYTPVSNVPAISSDSSLFRLTNKGPNSCYRFAYSDACGNESEISREVCALYLTNIASQPDVLSLQWNEYTGYKEGVDYYVLKIFKPDGSLKESQTLGLSTSIDLGEQHLQHDGNVYLITAVSKDGTTESSSNPYVLDIEQEAYFPNAFTPDGDGLNDVFKVEGKFVKSIELEIYNRWGELIFRTTDIKNGWDGQAKGRVAPTGTYIYKALVETMDGGQQSRHGTVFLIRR